jgi:hypothetical protein
MFPQLRKEQQQDIAVAVREFVEPQIARTGSTMS